MPTAVMASHISGASEMPRSAPNETIPRHVPGSQETFKNLYRHVHPSISSPSEWIRQAKPLNGYDVVMKHATGAMVMFSTTQKTMGTHVIYSGSVLQVINNKYGIDPLRILQYTHQIGAKMSRLDIAVDVFNSGIEIGVLESDFNLSNCDTQARTGLIIKNMPRGNGETLYIGSLKKRKKLLRIYDKGRETGEHADWIRIEYEIHSRPATQAMEMLVMAHDVDITIKSIIKGYCNFTSSEVWHDIFNNVHPTKLVGSSNTQSETQKWLLDVVAECLTKQVMIDASFGTSWNEKMEEMFRKYGLE